MLDLFDICGVTDISQLPSGGKRLQEDSLETLRLRISSSLTAPLINFLLCSSTTRTFHCTGVRTVSAGNKSSGEKITTHLVADSMADCVDND